MKDAEKNTQGTPVISKSDQEQDTVISLSDVINSKTFRLLATPISIIISGILISLSIILGLNSVSVGTTSNNVASDCKSDAPLSDDCISQYAKDIDINTDKFAQCIEADGYEDLINSEIEQGTKYGVQGTPSIYVGKGDPQEFKGFYAGASMSYAQVTEIVDYLATHSVDESSTYWKNKQLDLLGDFEVQVRDYYKSADGGALTGKALNKQVKTIVDSKRDEINTSYQVQTLTLGDGKVRGEGEVILMEFSDYECPYCRQFATDALKKFKSDYVESGKATFIFRDFPLDSIHPLARGAAKAARCAGEQDKYFEYHDKLLNI